jgi:hypothetical protein
MEKRGTDPKRQGARAGSGHTRGASRKSLEAPRQEVRRNAYFFMSFVSGCIEALVLVVEAVVEPLSEQAERVTTAKLTRQTNKRCFMANDYARAVPNVKWEE